jgi:glycosyltransferase involved in cell wall biosynthesis
MNTIKDFSRYKDNFVVVHQGADQPKISIVMPIYNCEEFVADAVGSILGQRDVVAEILISDDASTDDTFAVAYRTVIEYISQVGLKHTVLMRAGTARLVRDHLHLVAEAAICDVVCQAHGDDVSHPLRCSILVKVFNQEAKVSMIFDTSSTIDQEGKVVWEPKNFSLSDIRVESVKYEHIIKANDDHLIGSNMAWRKSSLKIFPQLTTSYCAYGHDRVMTFRAFLVRGCYSMDACLVQRRLHNKQLHRESTSFEHQTINVFNSQLIRLSLFSAIKKDLIFLKENQLIQQDNFQKFVDDVDCMIAHAANFLTVATGNLVVDGYANKWTIDTGTVDQ